jgi:hypothetical protein
MPAPFAVSSHISSHNTLDYHHDNYSCRQKWYSFLAATRLVDPYFTVHQFHYKEDIRRGQVIKVKFTQRHPFHFIMYLWIKVSGDPIGSIGEQSDGPFCILFVEGGGRNYAFLSCQTKKAIIFRHTVPLPGEYCQNPMNECHDEKGYAGFFVNSKSNLNYAQTRSKLKKYQGKVTNPKNQNNGYTFRRHE